MILQEPYIQKAVDLLNYRNAYADVMRLDVVDPVISGNKWFKLKNYLALAREAGSRSIITFGGPYSNHIVATAGACKEMGFSCTGIIRGEAPVTFSHTLLQAQSLGMDLVFISRQDYRDKKIPGKVNQAAAYIIPEGGYGTEGAAGISELLRMFDLTAYSHLFCAVGTGTMMAGLINASPSSLYITGIPVLKSLPGIAGAVSDLLLHNKAENFEFADGFHFNGYAKYNPALISFMNDFYIANNIPTDFVYTGKLFYAVSQITNDPLFTGKKILVVHSGGLQGNLSLPAGTLMF